MEKKKNALRNAILLSLLVGATAVYSPAVMAAEAVNEEAMEFAMEEYVVTASRTQTAKVDTPANVCTIDAAKIESRRYQDVAEALKDVPGATIVDTGTGAYEKKVMLNGDERVLVLVDGRRVNLDMGTMTRASFDLNQLPDVSQIERIEVVKGHGGSLYGSDAVGGVINIITKKMDHNYGKVSMAFGSNQARDGKAMYTIKEGKTGISVNASKYKQGYYKYKDAATKSTNRWPGQSEYTNEKVGLKINQELSDTSSIEVGYDFSKFDGHNPTFLHGTSSIDKKTNNIYAKYDWTINDNDQGYLNIYRNELKYEFQGNMEERDLGFEAQQAISTSDTNKVVIGASYRKADVSNEKSYKGEKNINNKAIFVNDIWDFAETWSLNAGARYDKHSTAGSKTTLSAGLNKKFDDNSHAYINWGQVFKAPTIDDLYYYYEDSYYDTVSKGNPNLKPEKGDTFTIGYGTKIKEKTDVSISYFQSKIEDAIDWSSDIYGDYTPENVKKQKKNGFELSIDHKLNDNWDLTASYTYVRVRNDNNYGLGYVRDANYLPNTYRFGVRYHDEKWNADLTMRAASGGDTTEGLDYDLNKKQKYIDSSYVTFDLAASYKASNAWTIFAKGYNLLNKAYAECASATNGHYDYPAQSRRFIVGAEYSF